MSKLLLLVSILQVILHGGCLPQRELGAGDVDPGEPLFLTPYIERGDIAQARRLARVELDDSLQIESYAGFFTVNKNYSSNQFLWYFPSITDKENAPVVLWLQGGPGASSLFGLFVENGPITVNEGQFQRRQYHWAQNYHLIYIDNPVGAGFSFTMDNEGFCTDETQVGEQLYSTVTQFFQLFPELQQHDFFITGESYAGKYVPALAYTIHKKKSPKIKLNLKGLAIGGAWINPESQQKFLSCEIEDEPDLEFAEMLRKINVRKAIHVGDILFPTGGIVNRTVFDFLSNDFEQSMAPWLSELLDYYPVTIYGGQHDTIVPYAGIVDFLRNHFNFTGVEEYRASKQYSWRVDGQWAGCVRRARLLTDVFVVNATHFVPRDQPRAALDMITRITSGKGFEQDEPCPFFITSSRFD